MQYDNNFTTCIFLLNSILVCHRNANMMLYIYAQDATSMQYDALGAQ